MEPRDIAAGQQLVELANWNQTDLEWELFLRLSPRGCIVAELEGRVVGTVATLDYGPFAWISMVLVHPEARGAGIGTGLMQQALDVLKNHPCVRLDATPLGEPVYQRLGFEPEFELARLERPAGLALGKPAGIRLLTTIADVASFDLQSFDADREAILSWLLSHAPDLAFVKDDEGYILGRRGRRFTHLGPIVSRYETTARNLLAAAAPEGPAIIDVPLDQDSWIEFLKSVGFREQRTLLRMSKGAPPPLHAKVFAIAGPELG